MSEMQANYQKKKIFCLINQKQQTLIFMVSVRLKLEFDFWALRKKFFFMIFPLPLNKLFKS